MPGVSVCYRILYIALEPVDSAWEYNFRKAAIEIIKNLIFNKDRRRQEIRIRKNQRVQADLARYGGRILKSDEMEHAFRQTHHTVSTVGEHTIRVAKTSLKICYALHKIRIPTDIAAVVTGALSHDLGILGRDEKFETMRQCSVQHPVDSVEVARNIVGELPDKTNDIIARHMWPVGGTKPPNSLEGAVVSMADKIATVVDFAKGCQQKRLGLKDTIQDKILREKG